MDIEIEKANSFFSKLRGLMFRRGIDHGLLFTLNQESRINASIHSFFVFFKFDAVFLNREGEIVDLRKGIIPFTPLVVPKEPCKYILELPSGKIDELEIEEGEVIEEIPEKVRS